eukprot:2005640-Amphidinium_carterae.2
MAPFHISPVRQRKTSALDCKNHQKYLRVVCTDQVPVRELEQGQEVYSMLSYKLLSWFACGKGRSQIALGRACNVLVGGPDITCDTFRTATLPLLSKFGITEALAAEKATALCMCLTPHDVPTKNLMELSALCASLSNSVLSVA